MVKIGFFTPGNTNALREMAGVPRLGDIVRLPHGNYVVKEVHWVVDKDGPDEADVLVVADE
ncbi:hypothetical protein [Isoptericola sp. NPDC056134]|uniref:hypothetical protein n=1 Tax=Isoptericola sp. NPDC056134 TaxID=3345723 RepID=UPI0035E96A02